ncbi:hypothetical protein DH09_17310 [Bacillaceae bacterium JMAK1]|nr:hypothetical protein DH09_17310 [Bacillaceae bacterium JMAK1]
MVAMLFVLLLAACNDNSEGTEEAEESVENEEAQEVDGEETITTDVPAVDLTAEGVLTSSEGELTAEHLPDEETIVDSYDQAEQIALQEFEAIVQEDGAERTMKEWLDFTVYQLGANHEEVLQRVEDYEVEFSELTLPDGRSIVELEDEELEEEMEKEVNVAILLDASGSMAGQVDGGQKMDLAKDAIAVFVQNIPDETNVLVQAYGHEGDNTNDGKTESCEAIENVYPLSPINDREFVEAVDPIEPTGWTPLADAMEQAKEDLIEEADENSINFIYVISDGIETCGGDPVAVAETIPEAGIDFEVNILGFDIADDEHEQLQEVAEVSGGNYSSVYTAQELDEEVTGTWLDQISQFAWIWWARDGLIATSEDQLDIENELRELRNDVSTLRNQENSRMTEAVEIVIENNELEPDEINELRQLIRERANLIQEVSDETTSEKRAEVVESRDRIQDVIRQLREEHTD